MKCQFCLSQIPADVPNCPVCGDDATVSREFQFERKMLVLSFTLATVFLSCLVWIALH